MSGVQFEKGPYYAQQGDFSAAGAARISYANTLDNAMVRAWGTARKAPAGFSSQ